MTNVYIINYTLTFTRQRACFRIFVYKHIKSCVSSQVTSLCISIRAQSDRRAISIGPILLRDDLRCLFCFPTYAAEQEKSRLHSLSYGIVPNESVVRQWESLGARLLISHKYTNVVTR